MARVIAGTAQECRIHRIETSPAGRPPARSAIHRKVVVLRRVLKTAERHRWPTAVPNLAPPYEASGKVAHRT